MTTIPAEAEQIAAGKRRTHAWVMRLLALGLLLGVVAGTLVSLNLQARRARNETLFAPHFGERGLVTNEFAYYNPHSSAARTSPDWEVTSGSLFARDHAGWSGIPDRRLPDATSSNATDSAVFRLVSRRAFGSVRVYLAWRLLDLVTTPSTPANDWDGLHVWLHYVSPQTLYYVSIARRDGTIIIGKKLPGGSVDGGHYVRLIAPRHRQVRLGRWYRSQLTIASDSHGTVTIRLLENGRLLARAVDRPGSGGATISRPGRIGIRGDNANFEFTDLSVHPA